MPRKCIDLESQPGFQEIYAPNMQQAIDEGLSGYSGTGVVDWGYDQDEVVKPPPRIKDESTKPRRKRKDFSRGKDESQRANRVRRQLFEAEEIGNPKGIFAQSIINGISDKGLDFIGRFLEANPLNTITWHGNKKKTSHFSVSGADGKFTFNITMKRGKSKIVSRVARHEFGHFVDYVLGLMAYKYDTRSQALYFSDLFPAFGEAFQKEITRLGLEPKKTVKGTGKEFIDKLVEDLVGPVDKITSQGLGIGSMNDILSEAAGILDIADAMTGGAWASRKFGGGHGIKYYKLKDADINGNPRLHETFANLFESWSSKDKRSWKRMKKYFPELTKEFDKMMSVYGDPTTTFNKVTGIGSSGPKTNSQINTNAPWTFIDGEMYEIPDIKRKVAKYTDERLDALQKEYAYPLENVKGGIATINPKDFLAAATQYGWDWGKDSGGDAMLQSKLDVKALREERQTPFLIVDKIDNEFVIVGHEGRHRMQALANAGIEEAPVLFIFRHTTKDDAKGSGLKREGAIEGARRYDERADRYVPNKYNKISYSNLVDIHYGSEEELKKFHSTGDAEVKFSPNEFVNRV